MTGFAGLPTLHRPDPGQQYLFVNGRPVKDKLLIGAVRAAYGDLLPGTLPLLALFVTLDPREVDVNVHPSKAEVRFRDAGAVRALVVGALRQALDAAGHRATASGGARRSRRWPRPARACRCWRRRRSGPSAWRARRPSLRPAASRAERSDARLRRGLAGAARRAGVAQRRRPRRRRAGAGGPADRPLGAARAQLHETYIVAQTRDGVVIVDQHAAHERLVYERLKAALANGGVARQVLLIPEIVELDADEAERAGRRAPGAWRRSGWCWRRSGRAR